MPSSEEIRLLVSRLGAGEIDVIGARIDHHDLEQLSVPDTAAAREAESFAREACSASLLNHSIRSYAWGALLGIAENRRFDSEVFYVASLLHDVGLLPEFDRGGCFEADGATVARELLARVGWDTARADVAANAIRDHWDGPESEDEVESLLLAYGTSVDVAGWRFAEIDATTMGTMLAILPRHDFKRHFVALCEAHAERKPHCPLHEKVQNGLAERVLATPYAE